MGYIDEVFDGYVECVLWVAQGHTGQNPADDVVTFESIDTLDSPDTSGWREDVEAFALEARQVIERFEVDDDGHSSIAGHVWENPAQIGHDFMLTRDGHGTGFWDRHARGTAPGRLGDELSRLAKSYGSSEHTWDVTDVDGVVWFVMS